jgi:glutamate synthase (NADPH/NADH) large chain
VLEDLNPVEPRAMRTDVSLLDRQQAFGYTQEDLAILMTPMATTGEEAVGSMGNDTPISALSSKSKLLYTYFKQNFAQVTNPPIDPIREELVMSLVSFIGPRPNLFDLEGGAARRKRLEVRQPILTNEDLEKIRSSHFRGIVRHRARSTSPIRPEERRRRHERGARRFARAPKRRSTAGYNIIILSDRMAGAGPNSDSVAAGDAPPCIIT